VTTAIRLPHASHRNSILCRPATTPGGRILTREMRSIVRLLPAVWLATADERKSEQAMAPASQNRLRAQYTALAVRRWRAR
jgi:hypothetical protein